MEKETDTFTEEDAKTFFTNYPDAGKYIVIPDFLTPSACEALINYAEKDKLEIGLINKANDINYRIRKNKVRFLVAEEQPELAWLYEKIDQAVKSFNETQHLSPLIGLQRNFLQLGRYTQADFYGWHQDGSHRIKRRLSFSIQLSAPNAYQGGYLQLFTPEDVISAPKSIGTLTIFTSSTVHRVSPDH